MQNRPGTFLLFGEAITAPPLEPALYLVATPIGNLSDITIRALQTLASADIVAAEDTRVSRVLLSHYGIRQKPVACHEHNEAEIGPKLIDAIAEGGSVALISDAGTPLVSDPGFRLVQRVVEQSLPVYAVPGAAAVLAALSVSALPTDRFMFAGFLPVKAKARRDRLAALASVDATLVFYESPRRLAASLGAMAGILGNERGAVVARELTKRFEEVRRDRLDRLAAHYSDAGPPRGEVVICVGPPAAAEPLGQSATDRLLIELADQMSAAKAAAAAAVQTGRPKRELYARLMELKGDAR